MIIGNPIMAGASGPAASIFVTGLSQTDTVTATNGSKTLTGKWTQKPNPAAHGLPDEYTELEYIKSTGTQFIKTGFPVKSTTGYEVDFALVNTSGNTGIIGGFTYGGYHHMFGTSADKWCAYYGNANSSNFGTTDTSRHVIEQNVTAGVVKLDGVQQLSGLTFYDNTSRNVNLFCFDGGSSYPTHHIGSLVLYSAKIYDNGTLVGNLTPCKRNSDGVIGMYDVISDVFYTNVGTGVFTDGPEIPKTIDGFLIKPIRDLGTWTVTATDGTNTATQDVLVDVITEYEIEMDYWHGELFYLGNEYSSITGGYDGGSSYEVSNDGTDLLFRRFGDSNEMCTVNLIPFEGYTTLKVKVRWKAGASATTFAMRVKDDSGNILKNLVYDWIYSTGGEYSLQLDISGVQTGRIWFGMNQYSTFAISKLWLE